MSNQKTTESLRELGKKVSKARANAGLGETIDQLSEQSLGKGVGVGWKISIEIVTAIVVCSSLGWALDTWLETTPWLMLVFLVLGLVAGINNAVRTAMKMDAETAELLKQKAYSKTDDRRS